MKFAPVIIVFLTTVNADAAFAQTTTRPQPRTAAAAKTPAAKPRPTPAPTLGAPIDPNAETLPANFTGNDIRALYAALSSSGPKGEFETTQQYEARLAAAGAEFKDKYLAFRPPLGTHAHIAFTYDADSQRFTGKTYGSSVRGGLDNDLGRGRDVYLDLWRESKAVREYEASNAYGAKAMIKEFEDKSYGLSIRPARERHLFAISVEVPVPVAEAPLAKSGMNVLFVCRLASTFPIIREQRYYDKATIDSPTEINGTEHYVRVEDVRVWVYDVPSGKVYKKVEIVPVSSDSDDDQMFATPQPKPRPKK